MPTTCPLTHRCVAELTSWLNGVHPTVTEGQVIRQVCFHWSLNCCNLSSEKLWLLWCSLRCWRSAILVAEMNFSLRPQNRRLLRMHNTPLLYGCVTPATAARKSCLFLWSKAPTQFHGKSYNYRFIVDGKENYWTGNFVEKHSSRMN